MTTKTKNMVVSNVDVWMSDLIDPSNQLTCCDRVRVYSTKKVDLSSFILVNHCSSMEWLKFCVITYPSILSHFFHV